MPGPHAVEVTFCLWERAELCKESHHKASPMLTHQPGEGDVHRGGRGITGSRALVGACEHELLPEEMGFRPAWLWSNSTTESDLEPGTGWRGCGCQLLAEWILLGSGSCLSPGGRKGGPLHHRHIPGEGTHHLLLCLGAKAGPGHITFGVTFGKSQGSPTASLLPVLAFLKVQRG